MLIAPFGVAALFFLNFACFLAHSLNLLRVKGMYAEPIERKRKGMWHELREGFVYVARHAGIGPMLALLTISSAMSRPVAEMLAGFADQVFGRGAQGLGWLLGATGAGGFIGAIWLTQRGPVVGLTRVVVFQTFIMGAATTAFACRQLLARIVFIFSVGFTQVVTGTGTQSLMQMAVDHEMRGRVMSLYALVWRGTPAIGAIVVGWVASRTGLTWAVAAPVPSAWWPGCGRARCSAPWRPRWKRACAPRRTGKKAGFAASRPLREGPGDAYIKGQKDDPRRGAGHPSQTERPRHSGA